MSNADVTSPVVLFGPLPQVLQEAFAREVIDVITAVQAAARAQVWRAMSPHRFVDMLYAACMLVALLFRVPPKPSSSLR